MQSAYRGAQWASSSCGHGDTPAMSAPLGRSPAVAAASREPDEGRVRSRRRRLVAPRRGSQLGAASGAGEHPPAEIDVPTAQADPQPLREYLDARVGEMSGQRLERVRA